MLKKCLDCHEKFRPDTLDPRFYVCPKRGIVIFEKWTTECVMVAYQDFHLQIY